MWKKGDNAHREREMFQRVVAVFGFLILLSTSVAARDATFSVPIARPHSRGEIMRDVGSLYVIHWAGYFLLFKVVSDYGGTWAAYRRNSFLKKVDCWDNDSFWWNFVAHPYVGSQTYLYYRARGYSRSSSFWGSFVASFLFESTIESFHTGFSVNDAIITPTLGYILGNWIERKSIEMVNSGDRLQGIVAKLLNPSLSFEFYEGVSVVPSVSPENVGFIVCWEF